MYQYLVGMYVHSNYLNTYMIDMVVGTKAKFRTHQPVYLVRM